MSFRIGRPLAIVLVLATLASAAAQESATGTAEADEASAGVLDDLFDEPAADTVVADTGEDYRETYVTAEKVALGGSFYALGGVAGGYVLWPTEDDWTSGLDRSLGAYAKTTLTLDARPSSIARVRASFVSTFIPTSAAAWPRFSIGELYGDYAIGETVFARLGQFTSVWGQGRLFAPGDLMSGSGSYFSLRASVPTLLDGVSFYAMTPVKMVSYQSLAYAAKADLVLAGTYLSGGVRYRETEGLRGLVSVKRVVFGTDLLADATIRWLDDSMSWSGVAGFFREWDDLKLYGEYYWAVDAAGALDHKAALAVGFNNIADTPLDFGVKARHALSDGSGVVLAAVTWSPWRYVTATVGAPFIYGDDGGYYVSHSYDDEDEDTRVQAQGLQDYRLGAFVTLALEIPF